MVDVSRHLKFKKVRNCLFVKINEICYAVKAGGLIDREAGSIKGRCMFSQKKNQRKTAKLEESDKSAKSAVLPTFLTSYRTLVMFSKNQPR